MKAAQWLATLTTLFHATDQTHGGQVCPKRGLAEELLQTPPGVSSSIGFPTSNSLHEANVPRCAMLSFSLQEYLLISLLACLS